MVAGDAPAGERLAGSWSFITVFLSSVGYLVAYLPSRLP